MASESLRTITTLLILQEKSDIDHTISMPDLISLLDEQGIPCARRAVYASIDALKEAGFQIDYAHTKPQGYYLKHTFQASELTLLLNLIYENTSLSKEESDSLIKKLKKLVSENEQKKLPKTMLSHLKMEKGNTLTQVDLLLKAIQEQKRVSFLYFDYNYKKEKVYRRNQTPYVLDPYAIVSQNGRFYCVFYSENHKNFANYRIDKMDFLQLTEESINPVYFDLDDWMRASFLMFTGDSTTVTAEFEESLLPIILDQFGDDVIISKYNDHSFIASIKTAITPTFISWILQFYDRIKIIKPQSLIEELLKIAASIQSNYFQ